MDYHNVVIYEYIKNIGEVAFEMVALYNQRNTNEAEVESAIRSGVSSEKVILMSGTQYDNIFSDN